MKINEESEELISIHELSQGKALLELFRSNLQRGSTAGRIAARKLLVRLASEVPPCSHLIRSKAKYAGILD